MFRFPFGGYFENILFDLKMGKADLLKIQFLLTGYNFVDIRKVRTTRSNLPENSISNGYRKCRR